MIDAEAILHTGRGINRINMIPIDRLSCLLPFLRAQYPVSYLETNNA